MELSQILEILKEPEKLVEPTLINTIVSYLGGFITDTELELDDLKIAYSFAWEKEKYGDNTSTGDLKPLTDKQTEIKMMRDPIYTKLNQIKRKLGELKRYRADLRSKLDIILSIKRY